MAECSHQAAQTQHGQTLFFVMWCHVPTLHISLPPYCQFYPEDEGSILVFMSVMLHKVLFLT
jgi:hypothetical protein